jgi:hypothetical protein
MIIYPLFIGNSYAQKDPQAEYPTVENCRISQAFRKQNPMQCGLLLLIGDKQINWPFKVEGLEVGQTNSIFDYIVSLLGIGIIFASILGIVFGLRIIFFQWIYYADQYNEEKLKEIKKKAWFIALGWGALVIGFVIISILNDQFGTNLL